MNPAGAKNQDWPEDNEPSGNVQKSWGGRRPLHNLQNWDFKQSYLDLTEQSVSW